MAKKRSKKQRQQGGYRPQSQQGERKVSADGEPVNMKAASLSPVQEKPEPVSEEPGKPEEAKQVSGEPERPEEAKQVSEEPERPEETGQVSEEPGKPEEAKQIPGEPGRPEETKQASEEPEELEEFEALDGEDDFDPESLEEFETLDLEDFSLDGELMDSEETEESSSELEFVQLDEEDEFLSQKEDLTDLKETEEPSPELEFAELPETEADDNDRETYWEDAAEPAEDGEDKGKPGGGIHPFQVMAAVRISVFLLFFAGMIYLLLPFYSVRRELTIEAGAKCPPVQDFLKWKNRRAVYVSEINENTVLDRVGDYGVIIRIYGRKVAAVLHVVDTVAPKVETRKVAIFGGDAVEVGAFVTSIEDVTPVTVRYAKEPDRVTEGINTVLLEIKDEGGNVTVAEALLEVIYDTEPPVIRGVKELTMTEGGSISYKKGITVTDNYDQDIRLSVDASQVDTAKPGDYPVTYTASDHRGNQTLVATVLHVLPLTIETVTEENINAKADEILASILTDSMSQYEKARAIYDWCHGKIAYSSNARHMPDWTQEAYMGLVDRRGDCYVYAATAKSLLTRAGIANLDIERIPNGNSMHQWNLIDIGEGWHHFDTCRRADGATFFYKTDEEIKAYSDTHNGTHNYDRSRYPEIE